MHPFRSKELWHIFPILKNLDRNSDNNVASNSNTIVSPVGSSLNQAKVTPRKLDNLQGKSKVFRNVMNKANQVFSKIQNSEEPMRQLGVGISVFHKL